MPRRGRKRKRKGNPDSRPCVQVEADAQVCPNSSRGQQTARRRRGSLANSQRSFDRARAIVGKQTTEAIAQARESRRGVTRSSAVPGFFFCPKRQRYFPEGTVLSEDEEELPQDEHNVDNLKTHTPASLSKLPPRTTYRGIFSAKQNIYKSFSHLFYGREIGVVNTSSFQRSSTLLAAKTFRFSSLNDVFCHRPNLLYEFNEDGSWSYNDMGRDSLGGWLTNFSRGSTRNMETSSFLRQSNGKSATAICFPLARDDEKLEAYAVHFASEFGVHFARRKKCGSWSGSFHDWVSQDTPSFNVPSCLAWRPFFNSVAVSYTLLNRSQLAFDLVDLNLSSNGSIRLSKFKMRAAPKYMSFLSENILAAGMSNGEVLIFDTRSNSPFCSKIHAHVRTGGVNWLRPLRRQGTNFNFVLSRTGLGWPYSISTNDSPLLAQYDIRRHNKVAFVFQGHCVDHRFNNYPSVDGSENMLAAYGEDSCMRLWNLRQGTLERKIYRSDDIGQPSLRKKRLVLFTPTKVSYRTSSLLGNKFSLINLVRINGEHVYREIVSETAPME